MSDLLFLAKDFIERMANPAYGLVANEEYALQFATLLQREGFEQKFLQEIREVKDRDTLSSYGWLWLIGWAKSRNIDLPTDLLVELFEEWSDVFIKTNVLDLATRNAENGVPGDVNISIEHFADEFLQRVMLSAVRIEREEFRGFGQASDEQEEFRRPDAVPAIGRAEALLVSLLQVGRPITLNAALIFLNYKWQGQRHMQIFFFLLYDKLDEESQAAWRRSLPEMPNRPDERR
jgi:hypothetical protein